jgi:hypothetical protein
MNAASFDPTVNVNLTANGEYAALATDTPQSQGATAGQTRAQDPAHRDANGPPADGIEAGPAATPAVTNRCERSGRDTAAVTNRL